MPGTSESLVVFSDLHRVEPVPLFRRAHLRAAGPNAADYAMFSLASCRSVALRGGACGFDRRTLTRAIDYAGVQNFR